MIKNYTINNTDKITTIRFSSQPDKNDIINVIDDIASSSYSQFRLWDLSNGGINLSSHELQNIAAYSKNKLLSPSWVAIVAPCDLEFGLCRMLEAYREEEGSETRIFRNEPDALVWLNKQINPVN